MSLETVRLSQRGKEQLIKLKRVTGIKQWNVLCRWALCVSLADPTTGGRRLPGRRPGIMIFIIP